MNKLIIKRKSTKPNSAVQLSSLVRKYLLKDKFNSLASFCSFHQNPSNLSVCQESWSFSRLIIFCETCQKSPNMCLCAHCFLNGNHEGHAYFLRTGISGNCDCGDSNFCHQSGFCCFHHGRTKNPDVDQVDPQTRSDVVAFSKCLYQQLDNSNLLTSLQTLNKLISLGDGMRRCVALGVLPFLPNFIQQLKSYPTLYLENMLSFFGHLINDSEFASSFAFSFFIKMESILQDLRVEIENNLCSSNLKQFCGFCFHFFGPEKFIYLLTHGVDISSFFANRFSQCYEIVVDFFDTKQTLSREIMFELFHFPIVLRAFHQLNRIDLTEKLINSMVKNLSDFELKNKREIALFSFEDPKLLTFIWNNIRSFNEEFRCLVPKINLLPFLECFAQFLKCEFSDRKSVLSLFKGAKISSNLFIHSAFPILLIKHEDLMKDHLLSLIPKCCLDIKKFLCFAVVHPLKFLLAAILAQINALPAKNPQLLAELHEFHYSSHCFQLFYSLCLNIQLIFGLSPEKNVLVDLLIEILDLQNADDIKTVRLVFLLFISSLAIDRSFLYEGREAALKDLIISLLFFQQVSQSDFFSHLPRSDKSSSKLNQVILSVATLHLSGTQTFFRVKPNIKFSLYSLAVPTSQKLNFLTKHANKDSKKLLDLPAFEQAPFGLDLFSLLTCSSTFAIQYSTVYDYVFQQNLKSHESLLVVYDQLLLISRVQPFQLSKKPFKSISFSSISQTKFPSFEVSFQTPIKFQNTCFSLFDLIKKTGHIGFELLSEMDIGFTEEVASRPSTAVKKPDISSLFKKISNQMNNAQNLYLDEENEQDSLDCPICHFQDDNDLFAFPVLSFDSDLSTFLDQCESFSSPYFTTCSHIFHSKCISHCKNCPVCRKPFSQIILIVPLYASLKPSHMDLLSSFLKSNDLFSAFSSFFTLADFKERNIPSSIESFENSYFLQNIYSLIWQQNQLNILSMAAQTPFHFLILETLKSKSPVKVIHQTIQTLSKSLSFEGLFPFLRRSLFFETFIFTKKHLNWDDELQFKNLCKRYSIKFPGEIKLKPFPLIELPKNFIDFLRPPFNLDLYNQEYQRLICLINGTFVKCSILDIADIPTQEQHIKTYFRNSTFPIPYLNLCGKFASRIEFYYKGKIFSHATPFYVDSLGLPDEGFVRGLPLQLNEKLLKNFIDNILSFEII